MAEIKSMTTYHLGQRVQPVTTTRVTHQVPSYQSLYGILGETFLDRNSHEYSGTCRMHDT